jgi:transketolase C-terminal domain/subunit
MNQTANALPDSLCHPFITQNLRIKHAYTGAASEVQGGAHAEFYKGAMCRLLNRIQPIRPADSSSCVCSRNFFLMRDNATAHTAAGVSQFLTQKSLQS